MTNSFKRQQTEYVVLKPWFKCTHAW